MSSMKIIFLFHLFVLIITFSNFGLCIRNEGADEEQQRPTPATLKFSLDDAVIYPQENASHIQKRKYDEEQGKIAFPDGYMAPPPKDSSNKGRLQITPNWRYGQGQSTARQRQNPYYSSFNTGEYYQSSDDYYTQRPTSPQSSSLSSSNYYPSQRYETSESYATQNYQSDNNPNYSQDNYIHDYNNYYSGNKRPNYYQRPSSPPRATAPPPPPPISYPYDYPYQQQSERPQYSNPYLSQQSSQQQQPQYDYPSYAGLFNNFQQFSNPLTNLFSGFAGRPSNPLGNQITKALADITENDDLNCVPKLLCEMIGDPERRAELPGFLTGPAVSSVLAILPVSSPMLVFGRAALVGFTGGEDSCDTTFNKCPKDEDDLLYYLNNHRGGFFRFFNGGESFSDVSNNFYNPNSQFGANRPQSQLYSQQSAYPSQDSQSQNGLQQQDQGSQLSQIGLGSLQSLLGTGGGSGSSALSNLNLLGTLASLIAPSTQNLGGSAGLGSVVGNLLSGLTGARKKSRKLKKRSLENVSKEQSLEFDNSTALKDDKGQDSLEQANSGETSSDEVEGRILNRKSRILSELNDHDTLLKFPLEDKRRPDSSHFRKGFGDSKYEQPYIRYPPYNDIDDRPYRPGKGISFQDNEDQNNRYPSQDSHYPSQDNRYPSQENNRYENYNRYGNENRYGDKNRYQNYNDRPPMIFPDRTGTGNLRFDSSSFDSTRDRDRYPESTRYGKIINRPNYPPNSYDADNEYYFNKRRPSYYDKTNRYDYYTTSTTTTSRPYYSNYNRYESTTRQPIYNSNNDYYGTYQANRYSSSRPQGGEGNVYVTNSKGVIDYYIKPNGQKVYV